MIPTSLLVSLPAFHPGTEFFLSCSGVCALPGVPHFAKGPVSMRHMRICLLFYLSNECFEHFSCSFSGEPERKREGVWRERGEPEQGRRRKRERGERRKEREKKEKGRKNVHARAKSNVTTIGLPS